MITRFNNPRKFGSTSKGLGEVKTLVQRGSRMEEIEFEHQLTPFADTRDQTVLVYWVNPSEREVVEKRVGQLLPRKQLRISSFIGHSFTFRRSHDGSLIGFTHLTRTTVQPFAIEDGLLHKCTADLHATVHDPHLERNLKEYDAAASDAALLAEAMQDLVMEKRLALSNVQVQFTPAITEVGFSKARLPAALFAKIQDWYAENHATLKRVESSGGPLYNQRVIPTWHTPLPNTLRDVVFKDLKDMMSAWAGGMELKGTSCYGVRTYQRDSYLHLHVDTAATHVISGIMNVNQSVQSEWPLEILDHSGALHSVNMAPGDLLFYESARLLHGRPHPLDGESYANIFVHYAPLNGWSVNI